MIAVPDVMELSPVSMLNVVVLPAPVIIIIIQINFLIVWYVANMALGQLTIDSKQPKALSNRYGQTDTIYSPFSGLDPTTAQMRRVDLVSINNVCMYSSITALVLRDNLLISCQSCLYCTNFYHAL